MSLQICQRSVVVSILLLLGSVARASDHAADYELEVTLKPISLPAGETPTGYVVSPDGQQVVGRIDRQGEIWFWWGDRILGPYDELANAGPFINQSIQHDEVNRCLEPPPSWQKAMAGFSPDSRHFVVAVRKGWAFHLIVDGQMGPAVEELAWPLHFSKTSETFACQARKDGRWGWLVRSATRTEFLTVQDGRTPAHPRIVQRAPHFFCLMGKEGLFLIADHEHTFRIVNAKVPTDGSMYIARVSQKMASKQFLLVDGEEKGQYVSIHDFWCTSDGHHFAYFGITEHAKPKQGLVSTAQIVLDGRVVEEIPQTREGKLAALWLSPDGRRYAYEMTTPQAHGRYFVYDGNRLGPYLAIEHVTFNARGDYFFAGRRGPRGGSGAGTGGAGVYVVQNGREIGPFTNIYFMPQFNPCFSPDGSTLAFKADLPSQSQRRPSNTGSRDERTVMVVDGRTYGPYDTVGLPVFSPDSRHLAFTALKHGKALVVLDGQESEPVHSVLPASVGFAPQSDCLWYRVQRDEAGGNELFARQACVGPSTAQYCTGEEHLVRGVDAWFGFTPDGRHLLCYQNDSHSGGFTLMVDGDPVHRVGGTLTGVGDMTREALRHLFDRPMFSQVSEQTSFILDTRMVDHPVPVWCTMSLRPRAANSTMGAESP